MVRLVRPHRDREATDRSRNCSSVYAASAQVTPRPGCAAPAHLRNRPVPLRTRRQGVICWSCRLHKVYDQGEHTAGERHMALVRMLRGGQVTLPAEARKALKLNEGDYLDLQVSGGTVTLKPVTDIGRAEAGRQLGDILSRVRYIGPEPAPPEDELMDMVVDEVRATRAKHAKGRSQ